VAATTRRHPGRPAARWHAGRDDQRLAGVAASVIVVVVGAGVSCLGLVIEPAASSRAIRVLAGGGRDAAGSFAQNPVLNTSPRASPRDMDGSSSNNNNNNTSPRRSADA
jgi:hypothetical protein